MTPDHLLYRRVRLDVTALLSDAPEAAAAAVPACPEWTVRDLAAHLADIGESVAARSGHAPPASPDREGLAEVLARWERAGALLEPAVAEGGPRSAGRLVMDAFTHELDLREALGAPPVADDHPAWESTLDLLAGGLAWSVARHGLPVLRIEAPGATWTTGDGTPAGVLRGDRRVLHRCFSGRLSPDRIAALDWDGDPAVWLPAFTWGPFAPPAPRP